MAMQHQDTGIVLYCIAKVRTKVPTKVPIKYPQKYPQKHGIHQQRTMQQRTATAADQASTIQITNYGRSKLTHVGLCFVIPETSCCDGCAWEGDSDDAVVEQGVCWWREQRVGRRKLVDMDAVGDVAVPGVTYIHTDKQTGRQADRPTDRHKEKQTQNSM